MREEVLATTLAPLRPEAPQGEGVISILPLRLILSRTASLLDYSRHVDLACFFTGPLVGPHRLIQSQRTRDANRALRTDPLVREVSIFHNLSKLLNLAPLDDGACSHFEKLLTNVPGPLGTTHATSASVPTRAGYLCYSRIQSAVTTKYFALALILFSFKHARPRTRSWHCVSSGLRP